MQNGLNTEAEIDLKKKSINYDFLIFVVESLPYPKVLHLLPASSFPSSKYEGGLFNKKIFF